MSKSIAFKDVIKCLNYLGHQGINEINLLHPSMDEIVKPILHELGMDKDKGFYVAANKLRTMDNEVVIGYRYVGTIRSDREWINSKACDAIDVVAISSFSDLSLTEQLSELLGKSLTLTDDMYMAMDEDDSIAGHISETYEEDSKLIRELNNICKAVRGV